jgi:hypothetical protein
LESIGAALSTHTSTKHDEIRQRNDRRTRGIKVFDAKWRTAVTRKRGGLPILAVNSTWTSPSIALGADSDRILGVRQAVELQPIDGCTLATTSATGVIGITLASAAGLTTTSATAAPDHLKRCHFRGPCPFVRTGRVTYAVAGGLTDGPRILACACCRVALNGSQDYCGDEQRAHRGPKKDKNLHFILPSLVGVTPKMKSLPTPASA